MNYVALLAGGKGTRMNMDMPKQYLLLGDEPIIIHTIKKYLSVPEIDKIVIAVSSDYFEYAKNIVNEYLNSDKIYITIGGNDRSESIINICKYISENFGIDINDNILTNDAVRPFVTKKMIQDTLVALESNNATTCAVPVNDTIFICDENGNTVINVPNRKELFFGQCPQGFKLDELIDHYNNITIEEKNILTEASKMYVLSGEPVYKVQGDPFNIKITTQFDYEMAKYILEKGCNK